MASVGGSVGGGMVASVGEADGAVECYVWERLGL